MPDEPDAAYYGSGRRSAADPYRDVRPQSERPYATSGSAARYDDGFGQRPAGQDGYGNSSEAELRSPGVAAQPRTRPRERGLPGWLAVVLLIGIAGACGLIDSISGTTVRGVFNWGLVAASLLAILLVRRSDMFPVVIAPPLVYLAASAGLLYVRTGGLSSRSKIIDVGTNWIVYGFPAIAGATAAVLLIAGFRLVTRR